jgi:hypothetical protein
VSVGSVSGQYGLANAVTRSSQDIHDYDQATELEKLGGKVIELNDKEWSRIDTAAAA